MENEAEIGKEKAGEGDTVTIDNRIHDTNREEWMQPQDGNHDEGGADADSSQKTSCEPPKYSSRGRGRWEQKGQSRLEQSIFQEIPAELIPSNAKDITFEQTGKLYKVLLHPGEENVTFLLRRGNLVKIHYKCWILTDPNQTIFDSSSLYSEDQEPVSLNLGERQVIRAIDDGVKSMNKKGEKALFIAHYDYAYGRKSSWRSDSSNVPNESFICVEIELVDVEEGAKLTGIYEQNVTREILHIANNDGVGQHIMQSPLTTNSLMFMRLEGCTMTCDDQKQTFLPDIVLPFTPCFNTWGFYTSGLTQHRVPYSLGPLLKCLKTGDKVLFTLSGECGFDTKFESNGISVLPGEPVKYLVEVEEIEEMYDPFMFSFQEKTELCEELIRRGVLYYNHDWYEAAACKFTRVREYLSEAKLYLKVVPLELGNLCDKQLYFALCKLAELFWKLPEMPEKEALKYCNEAINLLDVMTTNQGAENVKAYRNTNAVDAYYLRGKLYADVLKECGLAKHDLKKVLQLTEQSISHLQNQVAQMELIGDSQTDIQSNESEIENQSVLDQMKDLNNKVKLQFKQVLALEGVQARQNCIFKWMPPK